MPAHIISSSNQVYASHVVSSPVSAAAEAIAVGEVVVVGVPAPVLVLEKLCGPLEAAALQAAVRELNVSMSPLNTAHPRRGEG